MDANEIYSSVHEHYGTHANRQITEENAKNNLKIARAFGYSEAELSCIPKDANLGVSCGNPFATANISKGEVIIDLGSGAGFDVFLAASRVGEGGKVIGVDMNKEMLKLANRNLNKSQISNVLFLEASITSIPLPSETADCIISNCVINLVPETDKPKVFQEMFRLLKPGGRAAVSDLVAKKEMPDSMKQDMALYVGCIAGASLVGDYEKYLEDSGFRDVLIIDKHSDLNVYKEGNPAPPSTESALANAACCSTSCCSFSDEEPTTGPPISFQHDSPQARSEKAKASRCCGDECCGKADNSFADLDINEWIGTNSFRNYNEQHITDLKSRVKASVQIYALKPSK